MIKSVAIVLLVTLFGCTNAVIGDGVVYKCVCKVVSSDVVENSEFTFCSEESLNADDDVKLENYCYLQCIWIARENHNLFDYATSGIGFVFDENREFIGCDLDE